MFSPLKLVCLTLPERKIMSYKCSELKIKKIKIDEEGILRGCGGPCLSPGDPGEGEGRGSGG
jgi:hypothetical protein